MHRPRSRSARRPRRGTYAHSQAGLVGVVGVVDDEHRAVPDDRAAAFGCADESIRWWRSRRPLRGRCASAPRSDVVLVGQPVEQTGWRRQRSRSPPARARTPAPRWRRPRDSPARAPLRAPSSPRNGGLPMPAGPDPNSVRPAAVAAAISPSMRRWGSRPSGGRAGRRGPSGCGRRGRAVRRAARPRRSRVRRSPRSARSSRPTPQRPPGATGGEKRRASARLRPRRPYSARRDPPTGRAGASPGARRSPVPWPLHHGSYGPRQQSRPQAARGSRRAPTSAAPARDGGGPPGARSTSRSPWPRRRGEQDTVSPRGPRPRSPTDGGVVRGLCTVAPRRRARRRATAPDTARCTVGAVSREQFDQRRRLANGATRGRGRPPSIRRRAAQEVDLDALAPPPTRDDPARAHRVGRALRRRRSPDGLDLVGLTETALRSSRRASAVPTRGDKRSRLGCMAGPASRTAWYRRTRPRRHMCSPRPRRPRR